MIQCLNTRFDISSCHLYQNHFDAAREDAELCERLSVQIRSPRSEMLALMGLYFQHIAIKGDVSSGKPLTERSLMLTRQLGAPALEAFNLTWVARAENMAGDRNRALQHLDHAIEICHERAMKFCGPIAFGVLALATTDPEVRASALAQAEAVLASGCMSHCYLWFYRDAIETSLLQDEWEQAMRYASLFEDYTQAEPLPWSDFVIARGRALAVFGSGKRDASTKQEIQRLRDVAGYVGFKTALPSLEQALSFW